MIWLIVLLLRNFEKKKKEIIANKQTNKENEIK